MALGLNVSSSSLHLWRLKCANKISTVCPDTDSQKPFLCFLHDSTPVLTDFYYEVCKKWNVWMCAWSSKLKLCVTISLDTAAACSSTPCYVCPVCAASTLMLTEAVVVFYVAQNSIRFCMNICQVPMHWPNPEGNKIL